MDVRIGLTQTAKELEVQLGDDADADALRTQVEAALGGRRHALAHRPQGPPGRRAAEKLAYVEIGSPDDERRIGFGG